MHKVFIIAGLILYLFSGCQSRTDNSKLIDYDKLNRIKVKLAIEIGESEKYIPGELGDLVLVSDGTMLVSDWGKTTIEQFSAEGEYLGTIAKEGRGPGELPSFFLLYEGRSDTLIVWHGGMSRRVDYFSKGTGNIYRFAKSRIRKDIKNRVITVIGARPGTGYFAKTRLNYEILQQWPDNHPEYYWSPIAIVDIFDNILRDSLHMLKTPFPLIERFTTGAMMYWGIPPYPYQDHLRLMGNGRYLIARSDSSALYIYNRDHSLDRKIMLQVKERPVKESDLDYMFELIHADPEVRTKMEARVPDVKPPFLNVWVSQNHIWLHSDTREEGKQIVVLTTEGELIGKFNLSEYDDIRYFRNNRIYTLYKNPKTGHSIRIYKVEL